tara:strand:- start:4387 stop:6228 length:1842 start_codon:yes stop_codon:yes gene_type:complete
MAAEITKLELEKELAKEVTTSLNAVFKSVIPDIQKNAQEQVDKFEQALTTGTGKKIDSSLDGLNKFIDNFDIRLDTLGEQALKLDEVRSKLNKERLAKEEESAKLREKNIFAETEIVRNKKTGEIEVKNRLLTERQINNKKDQLIAEEAKLKKQEKDNLEKIRQYQQGEIKLNKNQQSSIIAETNNLEERRVLLEEEKKLFTGRSGRFDKRIGGFLDDFENALNDRAPDFLIPVIQPLIEVARQVQKTLALVIDGFTGAMNLIKKLPNLFDGTFGKLVEGINKTVTKSFDFIGNGFKRFDKGLKGVFDGVAKGFSIFRTKGLTGSIKALSTFTKRIVIAGLSALLAFAPFLIVGLKVIAVIGLVIAAFFLIKKAIQLFKDNIDVIKERLSEFGESISNSFTFVKDKLSVFADKIMEIPGKIKDFFVSIFTTIKNFFIDSINSIITLINKIKPGKDIELLDRVETPVKEAPAKPYVNNDEGKVDSGFKLNTVKPDFGEGKVDSKLQEAADTKALGKIRDTGMSKQTIVNLDDQNNKLDKMIDEIQIQKGADMKSLPKEFNIKPVTPEKEDKQEMTFAQNNSPINNVNQVTNQTLSANLARNIDDTFFILNKQSA